MAISNCYVTNYQRVFSIEPPQPTPRTDLEKPRAIERRGQHLVRGGRSQGWQDAAAVGRGAYGSDGFEEHPEGDHQAERHQGGR